MSTTTRTTTWVVRGGAGIVGAVRREADGFHARLFRDDSERGPFATLDMAKSAVRSALGPGADRLEFIAH